MSPKNNKDEQEFKARARVSLTLDVVCDSLWGSECTVAQVTKQAKREAIDLVMKVFNSTEMSALKVSRNIRIMGEPSVTMVMTEPSSDVDSGKTS